MKKKEERFWWRLQLSVPLSVIFARSMFQPENTGWWNGPFDTFSDSKKAATTYFHETIGVMTSYLHKVEEMDESVIQEVSSES